MVDSGVDGITRKPYYSPPFSGPYWHGSHKGRSTNIHPWKAVIAWNVCWLLCSSGSLCQVSAYESCKPYVWWWITGIKICRVQFVCYFTHIQCFRMLLCIDNNNNNHFMTLYPRQLEWVSTRRNIHPLIPILKNHPLSASFIYYDP